MTCAGLSLERLYSCRLLITSPPALPRCTSFHQFFTFHSAPSCMDMCTHTHTIFHVSFSTILYGYVCTHTEFVSFGSLISSLEYLVSSSSKIGFCCKCARWSLPNFPLSLEKQNNFKAFSGSGLLEDPEGSILIGLFPMHFILRTRGKYGEGAKQETFTFALTLVFIQCVVNAVFAKICEYLDNNLFCVPFPMYPRR